MIGLVEKILKDRRDRAAKKEARVLYARTLSDCSLADEISGWEHAFLRHDNATARRHAARELRILEREANRRERV